MCCQVAGHQHSTGPMALTSGFGCRTIGKFEICDAFFFCFPYTMMSKDERRNFKIFFFPMVVEAILVSVQSSLCLDGIMLSFVSNSF